MESWILRMLLAGGCCLLMATHATPQGDPAPSKGMLLVANKGDHTMGIIDPSENRQIATVPEDGVTAHEVAASPDGRRAFLPIYGNSGVGAPGTNGQTVDVVDLTTRRRIAK